MNVLSEQIKYDKALRILNGCVGSHGIWAGRARYARQNWTRDAALASMPALLELDRADIVRTHLANLARGQRRNGQVPILFLDGPAGHARFLADKAVKSVVSRRMSFMLGRYLRGELWNLTPGTRDSEILFLLALGEYSYHDEAFVRGFDSEIAAAIRHVTGTLMPHGLALGADWRDTMEKELADKPLLTNNAALYRALTLHRKNELARALLARIRETHFPGDRILDYPGSDRYDPLGGALARLSGVADLRDDTLLMHMFRSVDSPLGVTIKCRHNPITEREAQVIEETDGVVVWPFVVGFAVLAACHMGERDFAEEQFAKLASHEGFAEYYHPETGEAFGEHEQLWSAVLYLRAFHALRGRPSV